MLGDQIGNTFEIVGCDNSNSDQFYFLRPFRIQCEIKCKMTADVWAISPYVIHSELFHRHRNYTIQSRL